MMNQPRLVNYDVSSKILTNDEAVANRLVVWFRGVRGEMFFKRDLFIDIERYLFGVPTLANSLFIKAEIRAGLKRHFSDFTLESLSVTPFADQRKYKVEVILSGSTLSAPINLTEYLNSNGKYTSN